MNFFTTPGCTRHRCLVFELWTSNFVIKCEVIHAGLSLQELRFNHHFKPSTNRVFWGPAWNSMKQVHLYWDQSFCNPSATKPQLPFSEAWHGSFTKCLEFNMMNFTSQKSHQKKSSWVISFSSLSFKLYHFKSSLIYFPPGPIHHSTRRDLFRWTFLQYGLPRSHTWRLRGGLDLPFVETRQVRCIVKAIKAPLRGLVASKLKLLLGWFCWVFWVGFNKKHPQINKTF